MYKNKTILSIYLNINFITVVLLFLVNKKKTKNIESIYYLKYIIDNPSKNNIRDNGNLLKNYSLSLNYNFKNEDNIILLNDKLFLLSHINLLRNITRERKKGWYIIVDNMNYNNLNIDISLNYHIFKYMKCFELINCESQDKKISFYVINKLCAKILIFLYIICINRLYDN